MEITNFSFGEAKGKQLLKSFGMNDELIKGPGALFEILDGALAGYKYVMTNWQYSDPFGYVIVTQNLNIRIVDPVDPYSLVW